MVSYKKSETLTRCWLNAGPRPLRWPSTNIGWSWIIWLPPESVRRWPDAGLMLVHVRYAGPASNQHRVVLCLLNDVFCWISLLQTNVVLCLLVSSVGHWFRRSYCPRDVDLVLFSWWVIVRDASPASNQNWVFLMSFTGFCFWRSYCPRDVNPTLLQRWSIVCDVGQALKPHFHVGWRFFQDVFAFSRSTPKRRGALVRWLSCLPGKTDIADSTLSGIQRN